MKVHMLHAGYDQFGIGFAPTHDVWGPPCPPGPPVKYVLGFVEGPAFMGWHPGGLTHKKAKTVHADGGRALQHTHDCGYVIPHIPFLTSPPNAMLLIHMALSKHKVMFPIGKVILENKPAGTYVKHVLGMICSNPVSLPTGVLCVIRGTVQMGMTWKDLILGLVFIAVEMAIDVLWSKIMKGDTWRKVNVGHKWFKPRNWVMPSRLEPLFNRALTKPSALANRAFGAIGNRAVAIPVPALARRAAPGLPQKLTYPGYRPMLDKIYNSGMEQGTLKHWGRLLLQKWADHIGKSWLVGPVLGGTFFQVAAPLTGLDRKYLPSVAIGRAGAHVSFFPKPGIRANVLN